MKEIDKSKQAVFFNKAKNHFVAIDRELIVNTTVLKVSGIPVLKSSSTNRWVQVGTQQNEYHLLDLESIDV